MKHGKSGAVKHDLSDTVQQSTMDALVIFSEATATLPTDWNLA
jgi:hypothetical protein